MTADRSAFIVIFTARPEGGDWFCPEFLAHAGREDEYVRIPIRPEFARMEAADQRASVSAALVIDDTWDDVIHSDLSTYPPV